MLIFLSNAPPGCVQSNSLEERRLGGSPSKPYDDRDECSKEAVDLSEGPDQSIGAPFLPRGELGGGIGKSAELTGMKFHEVHNLILCPLSAYVYDS